jgi:hypothetical protein
MAAVAAADAIGLQLLDVSELAKLFVRRVVEVNGRFHELSASFENDHWTISFTADFGLSRFGRRVRVPKGTDVSAKSLVVHPGCIRAIDEITREIRAERRAAARSNIQ